MKRFIVAGLPFLFSAALLLAQDDPTATPFEMSEKQAAGFAAVMCGAMLIPMLISLGAWLWIGIWVTKDAKRRQSPNATLVTVLAWIPATSVIGLIVHLVTRPKTIPGGPNP